jgi:hypothetical protein
LYTISFVLNCTTISFLFCYLPVMAAMGYIRLSLEFDERPDTT